MPDGSQTDMAASTSIVEIAGWSICPEDASREDVAGGSVKGRSDNFLAARSHGTFDLALLKAPSISNLDTSADNAGEVVRRGGVGWRNAVWFSLWAVTGSSDVWLAQGVDSGPGASYS